VPHTGFSIIWVVEPIFESYQAARDFAEFSRTGFPSMTDTQAAARAGAVIGYGVCVHRCLPVSVGWSTYTSPWSCSVPCAAPGRVLSLGAASRGSRAVISA
jgi:hypothetical protein